MLRSSFCICNIPRMSSIDFWAVLSRGYKFQLLALTRRKKLESFLITVTDSLESLYTAWHLKIMSRTEDLLH